MIERLRGHGRELTIAALAGITAAVLLGGRIGRSFDYDESVTVGRVISRGSPLSAITDAIAFNNHLVFSAIQSGWWALGGVGEARQRLLPIAWAALAVAILVGWVARRWGIAGAAASALVFVFNPLWFEQARLVRGYSLSVLGVVVALVALAEYARQPNDARSSRWLVAHGVAAVVAVGTHGYAALPLLGLGVFAIVSARVDRRLWGCWAAAIAATILVYLPTAAELSDTAAERGSRWRPGFAGRTLWELFGRDRVTAVVVGAASVVGMSILVRRASDSDRRGIIAAIVAIAGAALSIWLVLRPFDLYARFFVTLVPLVALAVGRAVQWHPALLAPVSIGIAFTVGNVFDARMQELPLRDVAQVVDTARADDLEPCVVGGEALVAYTAQPAEFLLADDWVTQFETCDVLVSIGSWGRPMWEEADEFYGRRRLLADAFPVWAAGGTGNTSDDPTAGPP